MLDAETRTAILRLHREGHGLRRIARALGVSRNAVRRVLQTKSPEVPRLERQGPLDEHLDLIRELVVVCEGNLVRVGEKLADEGIATGYSTLTRFCRRHGIGRSKPKPPAGRYVFEPGEEMQHDTSPHDVTIGSKRMRVQCASLVLCYSRRLFARAYRRFRRFECRAFLTEAIPYLGGAASRCIVDNTSVVRAHGTGSNMVPAAEMLALSKRFEFDFVAHAIGDANRSARVEGPFYFIERNFYPGRTFTSLDDLNAQLRAWCDKVNAGPRKIDGQRDVVPMELYAAEQHLLSPLPLHIPTVYELHGRRVDAEGYVNLHTNRYSVPSRLPNGETAVGRWLEVRETLDAIIVLDGHDEVARHARVESGLGKRLTLEAHRDGRWRKRRVEPAREEKLLAAAAPELAELAARLRKRHGGQGLRPIRRLHRMYLEYPTACLIEAARTALHYGLLDLGRLEAMTLERIRGDFFRLPVEPPLATTPAADEPHEEEHDDGRRAAPAADEPEAPPGGGDL